MYKTLDSVLTIGEESRTLIFDFCPISQLYVGSNPIGRLRGEVSLSDGFDSSTFGLTI